MDMSICQFTKYKFNIWIDYIIVLNMNNFWYSFLVDLVFDVLSMIVKL